MGGNLTISATSLEAWFALLHSHRDPASFRAFAKWKPMHNPNIADDQVVLPSSDVKTIRRTANQKILLHIGGQPGRPYHAVLGKHAPCYGQLTRI